MSEKDIPEGFIPYSQNQFDDATQVQRGQEFYEFMDQRRSVRFFSDKPVPRELIDLAIKTASTAPSGAHRQPWHFVAISDPELKKQIRIAAEEEEKNFYTGGKTPPEWLQALAPLGTDWHKPFLETVPWIVVVFEEVYGHEEDGSRRKNYYVKESVGIACGMFITALHNMGLSTLTHTPNPMTFLSKLLDRPKNEKPYILFPIGYAADDAIVPDIVRKPLNQVAEYRLEGEE